MLIRRIQFCVDGANACKLQELDRVFDEARTVVNAYIARLWQAKDFKSKFVDFKVETWLSARMQQALGKQALEIVKSQRKRKRKTMPVFRQDAINLDSRFIDIKFDSNSFDIWFRLQSLGDKLDLKLPAKKHAHFHTLTSKGYALKRSARLRKSRGRYFVDLYTEKLELKPKAEGETVGFDCGYKTMLADSRGNEYGNELEACYEKISRKRQGSKAFKRALTERDNLIGKAVNAIDLSAAKTVVVEALKNVKHATRGRMRKQFVNKLQRWSYPKVLDKLARVCEDSGIQFLAVDPSYTSQTCSLCGHTDKASRNGKRFACVACGYEADADFNASTNIRDRGIYSSPALA